MASENPPVLEREFRLPVALHARPAAQLVRAVAPCAAQVRVSYRERAVDARSILSILGLAVPAGASIVVRAEGAGAAAALEAVALLVERNFDEQRDGT